MSNAIVVLTPLLVFIIVALLGFVGCGDVLPAAADPPPDAPPDTAPKPKKPYDPAKPYKPPTGSPVPTTYQGLVEDGPGFAAFWPLNEMSGTTANYVGNLTPAANGEYKNPAGNPASIGSFSLGREGVLFPKDKTDFAVELQGTEAFIEVPFVGALNPVPTVPGFSIELWAKPNPAGGADRAGLISSHHFDSDTSQQGYEIGLLKVAGQAHQQVYARVYGGPAMTVSEITVQPADGAPDDWRHIVLQYGFFAGKGYQIRLRVQVLKSAEVSRAESTAAILYDNVTLAKSSTLRFGGTHLQQPVTAPYAGLLDNIAFYNALVDDAIFDDHFKFVS